MRDTAFVNPREMWIHLASMEPHEMQHFHDLAVRVPGEIFGKLDFGECCTKKHLSGFGLSVPLEPQHFKPSEGKFECWKLHPTAVSTVWWLIHWFDCRVCTVIFCKVNSTTQNPSDYWKKPLTDANQICLSQGQFWVCWLLKYKSNWRESSLAGAKPLWLAKIQVYGWQAHP